MHEQHPLFRSPTEENERIWRYMDFTKFVSMLHTQSLFFCRADKFSDHFEGSYTALSIRHFEELAEASAKSFEDDPIAMKNFRDSISGMPSYRRLQRQQTAINCWHRNERESAAMWSLYLKSDEGIAVASTYSRLCNSVRASPSKVYIGAIEYIDYETESFPLAANMFSPYLHKRKSFEHEKELRAVVTANQPGQGVETWSEGGVAIGTDLDILVDTVYVAPTAPAWFASVVAATIGQFGRKFPVVHSDLSRQPLF